MIDARITIDVELESWGMSVGIPGERGRSEGGVMEGRGEKRRGEVNWWHDTVTWLSVG